MRHCDTRIHYVGIWRAKERPLVSYRESGGKSRAPRGRAHVNGNSPFLMGGEPMKSPNITGSMRGMANGIVTAAIAAAFSLAAGLPARAAEVVLPDHPDAKVMIDTAKFKKPGPYTIGYADASQSNSWRIMAKAQVEYGISLTNGEAKLVYANANDDTNKQIADIEDLLAQHVDAIILGATEVNALCPSIDKAIAQNVPVIILERFVNCKNYTQFIDDRDDDNGLLQGAYIVDKLGGKGNIVIIGGVEGNGSSIEEENGIKKMLSGTDIKVLAVEYANYQPAKCKQIMQTLLTRYPQIDAVASISGNQGVGCYDAVKAANRVGQVKAWTGDDANGWMKIVQREKIPSIITPIPTYAGKYAVLQAVNILKGGEAPKDYLVPKPEINGDNIDKFAKQDRPDEWWYSEELPCKFDPYCKK
ncbi:MAG: substrate-binding domain-containing protein [Roseiarcus sp.]